MNTREKVSSNERNTAFESLRYKWAFAFVTFALLADVMYRGIFRDEAAWDLMALAIFPGLFCAGPLARQKALADFRPRNVLLVTCLAAVVGVVAGFIVSYLR